MNPNGARVPNRTPCRYFQQGFCWRGNGCWFAHTPVAAATISISSPSSSKPAASSTSHSHASTSGNKAIPILAPRPDDFSLKGKARDDDQDGDSDDELMCSICFEPPQTWGLLECCDHAFCLGCIRQWRSSKDRPAAQQQASENCPTCRRPCKVVTPSSLFLRAGPEKTATLARYRKRLSEIRCRYLAKGPRPWCPFGTDCLYSHQLPSGATPVFTHTHADTLRERATREARLNTEDIVQALIARAASISGPGARADDLRGIYHALDSLLGGGRGGGGLFGFGNDDDEDVTDWEDDDQDSQDDDSDDWEDDSDSMPPLEALDLSDNGRRRERRDSMPALVADSSSDEFSDEDGQGMPPLIPAHSSSQSQTSAQPPRRRDSGTDSELPPLVLDSSSESDSENENLPRALPVARVSSSSDENLSESEEEADDDPAPLVRDSWSEESGSDSDDDSGGDSDDSLPGLEPISSSSQSHLAVTTTNRLRATDWTSTLNIPPPATNRQIAPLPSRSSPRRPS